MTKTMTLVSTIGIMICLTGIAKAETFESIGQHNPTRIERSKSEIIETTSAEFSKSPAKCDFVYHIADKNAYILGGCNVSYATGNSSDARKTHTGHGRINLRLVN